MDWKRIAQAAEKWKTSMQGLVKTEEGTISEEIAKKSQEIIGLLSNFVEMLKEKQKA